MPWSITFNAVCRVMVMMREPPGEPSTIKILLSLVTSVGLIDDSGRLPGAMLLAVPCTSPYRFFSPTLTVKSSISSLRKKPVPGAIPTAPKRPLTV